MWPFLEVYGFFIPVDSLLLAVGILVGLGALFLTTRRKRVALDFLADHFFILFLATMVSARLSEVVLHSYSLLDLPFFWQDTGFDFYGGAVGFLVTLFVLCRLKGENFLLWLDLTLLPVLATLIFYHLGTLAAGTAFGKPTGLPWGITFINPDAAVLTTLPIHPTQVYALLATLGVFLLGAFVFKNSHATGQTAATSLILAALSAFFIDFLRDDSAPTFGLLREAQYFALGFVIFGSGILYYLKHTIHPKRKRELHLHTHRK